MESNTEGSTTMAKKTAEKPINIDNILFNCRDILRAARNSGSFFEKRDMMLTLIFLRFIGEKYEDGVEKLRKILIEQGLDPDDENIRTAYGGCYGGRYGAQRISAHRRKLRNAGKTACG